MREIKVGDTVVVQPGCGHRGTKEETTLVVGQPYKVVRLIEKDRLSIHKDDYMGWFSYRFRLVLEPTTEELVAEQESIIKDAEAEIKSKREVIRAAKAEIKRLTTFTPKVGDRITWGLKTYFYRLVDINDNYYIYADKKGQAGYISRSIRLYSGLEAKYEG